MKGLFVDTAGWMACADQANPQHRRACEARDAALSQGGVLITTDYVVDENLTLLKRLMWGEFPTRPGASGAARGLRAETRDTGDYLIDLDR